MFRLSNSQDSNDLETIGKSSQESEELLSDWSKVISEADTQGIVSPSMSLVTFGAAMN